MDVKINNPEQIPEQIVRAAIAMMEQEEGRTVQEISIRRTGKPDEYGILPVFVPVPFQRIRRISGGNVRPLQQCQTGRRTGSRETRDVTPFCQRLPWPQTGPRRALFAASPFFFWLPVVCSR